jgi:pectate lyase
MPDKSRPNLIVFRGLLLLFSIILTGCLAIQKPVTTVTLVTTVPPITPVPVSTLSPTNPPNLKVTDTLSSVPMQLPAFPGAEGFGAFTTGGRGGKVIEVTNLNDSGRGSLREAINTEGPRIVIFRAAGTIELDSGLIIANPYITIAGQTAPGGGITLRGINSQIEALIKVETHDVVIRFLTLRAGPPSAGDGLEIIASDAHENYNVVIDHNSVSWAVNRNLTTWYDAHEISIQWNIFAEGLNCSIHPKGCHSKGVLLGGYASDENKDKPGAGNISFHHNLMAHNGERNPLITLSGVTDVVNNVTYNPFGSFSHVDFQQQLVVIPANYVGNYFKPGANTDPNKYGIDIASQKILGAEIFVLGNIGPRRLDDTQPDIDVVDPNARPYVVAFRHPAASIKTTSALEAYDQVLADAGANAGLGCDGTFYSRRDVIDARIVNDVRNGLGKIIDDPSEVGGWLAIPQAIPCADFDQDGISDGWEEQHGFNSHDPADASMDVDGDGYTNIEEYINGSDPLTK